MSVTVGGGWVGSSSEQVWIGFSDDHQMSRRGVPPTMCRGGSKGGGPRRPPWTKNFLISCSFWGNWQTCMLAPPPTGNPGSAPDVSYPMMWCYLTPLPPWTDTRLWKHYLPTITIARGNNTIRRRREPGCLLDLLRWWRGMFETGKQI